jgi:diacylglycerol kinase (ATP)
MLMAPDAHTDDGEIDVVTVGPVSRLELLKTFPRIFTGTHIHHPAVSVHRSSRVQFHMTEAIDMMLDGEILTGTPRSLRVHAGALDIYV